MFFLHIDKNTELFYGLHDGKIDSYNSLNISLV